MFPIHSCGHLSLLNFQEIAETAGSENKWKQLGDLAMSSGQVSAALRSLSWSL